MHLDSSQQSKALEKAESLANDFDPQEAEQFARKHEGAKWFDDFKLLFDMITDSHFTISRSTYLTIAGALAYVILPVDILPDFIPGIGFIDDVFVVGFVMKSLSDDITRYRRHRHTT